MALATGNLKRVHLELGGKAPFIVTSTPTWRRPAWRDGGSLINGGQD